MDDRAKLENQYKTARSNLLAMTVLSAVNVVLLLLKADISFLFSAIFPALAVQVGLLGGEAIGGACFAAAFLVVGFYGVFYVFSKKYKPFMLAALVFFAVDTLLLLWMLTLSFEAAWVINIAFHVWVLWYLARGVQAWLKLRSLPDDEPPCGPLDAGTYHGEEDGPKAGF